ncbi:MAG TPA: carboxypeptidase-like regulatory domain-containing protein [Thermoanaerobaculia bacterium]|nr:carboxypeptidase-like regulatory domain-containing protein [Thermoanaerobaculia bacterium]
MGVLRYVNCVLATLALTVAAAGERRITIEVRTAGATPCASSAHVLAECDRCGQGVVDHGAVDVGATSAVPLSNTGDWRIKAVAPGCWSNAIVVARSEETQRAILTLWPEGKIRGRVIAERRAVAPSPIDVSIALHSSQASPDREPLACTQESDNWECAAPATLVDLRVAADGWSPAYAWDIDVKKGETKDVGVLRLQTGASVAGWIAADRRNTDLTSAVIELTPESLASGAAGAESAQRVQRLTTKPTARGFFQFAGLQDGSYELRATNKDGARGRLNGIVVAPRSENLLHDPVVLHALANIDLVLQPPVAPGGGKWSVMLERRLPLSDYFKRVADAPATDAGSWGWEGLEAGEYRLLISSGSETYHDETVKIDGGTPLLHITLPVVEVRGTLSAGDDAITGQIVFRTPAGEHVTTKTGDDGHFVTVLPKEGRYSADISPAGERSKIMLRNVEVKRRADRDYAELELTLPGGRIRGSVVDDDGNPVRALIRAATDDRTPIGGTQSDQDGAFQLTGVPYGDVLLDARSDAGECSATLHHVEKTSSPVRLVVSKRQSLTGFVMTMSGQPIAGALVKCVIPPLGSVREAVSAPTGRFVLSIPSRVASVDVIVMHPALPTTLRTLSLPQAGALELVVPSSGGILIVHQTKTPPWPSIRQSGQLIGLDKLMFPPEEGGPPRNISPRGIQFLLAPGQYTICGGTKADHCKAANVFPNAEVVIDGDQWMAPVHDEGEPGGSC